MTVSILVNAVDGPVEGWLDGVVQILDRFAKAGPLQRLSPIGVDDGGTPGALWTWCRLVKWFF